MKKGLVMIIMLSLALMASSCQTGNVIVLSADDGAGVPGSIMQNGGDIVDIFTTPTVEQVLNTALELDAIDNTTKSRISIILDFLPELDGWLAGIPGATLLAIDEIMGNVTESETVSNATAVLQGATVSGQYDDYEWLPEALEFGIDLLEAGANTIYNPGWSPYAEEPLIGFNVSQLWKEALQGGVEGAVGCALAGIAPYDYGVKIGGVVGAVDSSIADFIDQLADWWE
jgi:hypothetical protein